MRCWWNALWLVALTGLAGIAQAHEMSIAEMELREVASGDFVWQWTATDDRAAAAVLTPQWPEACTAEANTLRCGSAGLSGVLSMDGVGKVYSAALVKVYWRNGDERVYTLTESQPKVHLYGSADDARGMGEVASAYTQLGVEHILSGYDHLLFVIGLLFLVGFQRRLFWTITAFTAAHSVTLALSALGWLTLRSPPVEATIALSIMLVAAEALNTRPTLARRWPALVAFLFGLVHGLGFAGALQQIGLPVHHLAVSLLSFNVGVEAGQLLVVGLAFVGYKASARRPAVQWARRPALYAIGSVAAFWSIGRLVSLLG